MKIITILKKLFTNRKVRFIYLTKLGLTKYLTDKQFLKMKYRCSLNRKLRLESPETFNEKLQWLKLHDRQPQYTIMADKYKVREYIAETIGEEYLIPLYGVWESSDDINFDDLPDQFVLKCNHNSGLGMCICTDKLKLDIQKVRKELKKGLKENYFMTAREWPYKHIPRRIIAEEYLQSENGIADYKIHCFNGEPKFILVCQDRFTESGLTEDFFTCDWNHMNLQRPKYPNSVKEIKKPDNFEEMLMLARKLSQNIPFVRVDLYNIDGKIYFSELTFYPASGFEAFEPDEWDRVLGKWLTLPDARK